MIFIDQVQVLCKQLSLPDPIKEGFLDFCKNYENAIRPKKPSLDVFTTFLEAVKNQLKAPYAFLPYHASIRSPTDYYRLGLDFVRPLINFEKSQVFGKDALNSIQKALEKKENVILLANHQTEIDPQIISLLLENEYPELAQQMIFVAGHRVTTDPLAVPLSLGRNLICIYSKRHVDTPPEKKAEKMAHNQKALKGLEELLAEGGKCIYIAPSGGRDRRDEKGQFQVAPFDPQAVEMFYLLAQKAKQPTHFHSLALLTYSLLPPPPQVQSEIGEERKTNFSPAYLCFSPEIVMHQVGDSDKIADKKERRKARAEAIWQQVVTDYMKF